MNTFAQVARKHAVSAPARRSSPRGRPALDRESPDRIPGVAGAGFDVGAISVLPPTPRSVVQAKLTVGAPGDSFETEADQMSERVMTMPSSRAAPEALGRLTDRSPRMRRLRRAS